MAEIPNLYRERHELSGVVLMTDKELGNRAMHLSQLIATEKFVPRQRDEANALLGYIAFEVGCRQGLYSATPTSVEAGVEELVQV